MQDSQVAIAALAVLGTISTGFFAQARQQNKTQEKIAKGLDRLAKVHEKGNREAELRNGHLAELVVASKKQLLSAVQTVREQKVEHQVVEKAKIEHADIKK